MPVKDLHAHPFDEGTITKLEIFENYAKEWLPTFIMSYPNKDLWMFDFFAGTGKDQNGVAGTPIRLLQQVKSQAGNIFNQKCKINICLNELDENKFNSMQICCEEFVHSNNELLRLYDKYLFLHYRNSDFAELFPKTLDIIKGNPSLLFLDQNGMKFLADKYILDLEKLSHTDFLYFLSSSYFFRFGNTPEFQTNLRLDMEKIKENPYKYVHRSILEQLKNKLPNDSDLKLYPFTIKKGANIYGIIFGAKHPRAVDKFLKTAWNKNNINGEANFDIDEDNKKCQLTIFGEKPLTKIEGFQQRLRELILSGEIKTNREAYDYTISQGHVDKHAAEEISKMKKEGIIDFEGRSSLVNYEQTYKNKRTITFHIVKK